MSQVGTDQPPRITRARAQMAYTAAEAAYFRGQAAGERTIPDGFTEIKHDGALGEQMKKADCLHLKAPDGTEIVAFRGTANARDWKDNVKQVAGSAAALPLKKLFDKSPKGLRSEKYDAAAKIGDAFRVAKVIFTGHSLGGGLAKLAGEVASTPKDGVPATSKEVISFNGAPVTPQTYKYYGCAPKNHLRTTAHIINQYDLLNRVLPGGKSELTTGDIIKERASGNTSIVHVQGGGDGIGVPGHGLKAFDTLTAADGKRVFDQPAMIVAGRDLNLAQQEQIAKTPVRDPAVQKVLKEAAQLGGRHARVQAPGLGR